LKLQYLLFIILFSTSIFIQAQKEAAIWYFGENAGLDFNSGTPVALTDGQLNTHEGCATISDSNGSLLFYTDGITVWNRNHLIMPNGTDLNGDPSSTQSAIIVPKSDEPNIYFLFTVDEAGGPNGLQYSVVDMNLDGGMGDITAQKGIPLISRTSEKICAVAHSDGQGVWVITRSYGGNSYYSFLVDASGINTTPVVTNIGPLLPQAEYSTIGYMKTSPDGKFLVSITDNDAQVDLMRFNTATGTMSDHVSLKGFFDANRAAGNRPYGGEFSMNNNVLYITTRYNLTQFDLSTYEQDAIINSGHILESRWYMFKGALQMGIDGKIYETNILNNYLNVINNPNVLGDGCDFVDDAVYLGPGAKASLGLPPFISSFFDVGIEAKNLCLGNETEFSIEASEPITSILWDFGDGTTATKENPGHTYAAAGDYTVSVTVNTASNSTTETEDITISEIPKALPLEDITACITQDAYDMDLQTLNTSVLGTQDPDNFSVDYFLSQSDADTYTNVLENTHSFALGTTLVYIRASNKTNTNCYTTAAFNIIARQAPVIDTVLDWTVCDDDTDRLYSFDLSLKADEIYNDQDKTKFEILYFGSQADADAGTNPLPESYVNTAVTEEIFFRFQNSTYPTCYRTGSFILEVIPGVVANQPSNLEVCDDNNDGQANFDLRLTEPEIIGTQNTASMVISYHGSQNDADTGTNALNANSYLSTAYQNTIYVRVENASDTSCYDTTSFDLIIYDTPVVPTVTDWQLCDDNNDGRYTFDLTEKTNEIQAGNNGITVSYYTSLPDAEVSQNTVVGTFENTLNPQPVYYRMENQNNAQCYAIGTFVLHVFDTPTANTASDIIVCDSNKTGTSNFDLSQKDGEVLNGQDAMVYEVSYFTTELEAMNNENPLSKTSYQNSNLNETLWARVQHNQLDFCYDVSSFNLIVNPLPQIDLEEQYVVCPDSPELVIDGGDFETWAWQDSNGTVISTQRNLQVLELGDYSLTVTQTTNGLACENTAVCNVVSSGAPETLVVDFNGFSDEIQVELLATGVGQFEYSIDGENYQSSNRFTVFPGSYTVYVRDLYDCRTITDDITVIGYQRFFTPNGDGVNEHWNIIGRELYPNSQLYIFNRYGKLVGQFGDDSLGWDGRYNGQELSPTDYWFRFAYGEGEVFSGHFTLKR